VHIEWRGRSGADDVVYARVVCPICDVKSFREELKTVPVAELENTAHTHIESGVVRSKPCISSSAGRTVVGKMIVAIDVGARD
jgi:hypothetical protein